MGFVREKFLGTITGLFASFWTAMSASWRVFIAGLANSAWVGVLGVTVSFFALLRFGFRRLLTLVSVENWDQLTPAWASLLAAGDWFMHVVFFVNTVVPIDVLFACIAAYISFLLGLLVLKLYLLYRQACT